MTPDSSSNHSLIPTLEEISSLCGISFTPLSMDLLRQSLIQPVDEFLSSGGKKLRVEIIELGFMSASGSWDEIQKKRLAKCSQIIEGLHAGSMIIDDIQDESKTRRGQPTLHERYGVAIALNAGNWLYFQALHQIKDLGLKPAEETLLKHYANEIILRAHFGQALDVGTPMSSIPQDGVKPTCLAAMELKTGALMSLAFDLGAFAADQRPLPSWLGLSFGKRFGVALQMFDDIGNFLTPGPKSKEDLRNNRPSFIWAMASILATAEQYQEFLNCTKELPHPEPLENWARRHQLIEQAKIHASQYLWSIFEDIAENLESHPTIHGKIQNLFKKLESSYV